MLLNIMQGVKTHSAGHTRTSKVCPIQFLKTLEFSSFGNINTEKVTGWYNNTGIKYTRQGKFICTTYFIHKGKAKCFKA